MTKRLMIKLLPGLIALGFVVACGSTQKPTEPVGKPPSDEERRVPTDTTDEDVKPEKALRVAPDTQTPVR